MSCKTKFTLLAVFLLLVSPISITLLRGVNYAEAKPSNEYQKRDPIRIDNNLDFALQAQKEDWTGNGTKTEPYIIEGYEIDASDLGNAIYIGNVTVYFIIRNCYIHNASANSDLYFENSGIYLYNTANGIIKRNIIISNMETGIYIQNSFYITMDENELIDNLFGIKMSNSQKNWITNNYIKDNLFGIHFLESGDNDITYNMMLNNGYGIYLEESHNNLIYHNDFFQNKQQAWADDSVNQWDDGYSSGGNYWSDYESLNPEAQEINNSGIWNVPYDIPGENENEDRYPLTESINESDDVDDDDFEEQSSLLDHWFLIVVGIIISLILAVGILNWKKYMINGGNQIEDKEIYEED